MEKDVMWPRRNSDMFEFLDFYSSLLRRSEENIKAAKLARISRKDEAPYLAVVTRFA